MGNNNMICKADIKPKSPVLLNVLWIVITAFGILWLLPLKESHSISSKDNIFGFNLAWSWGFLGKPLGILILLTGIFLCIYVIVTSSSAKKCSLELFEDKIDGNRKTAFSSKALKLPIDKVDNIMTREGFFDKIWGGKTVGVRSASGVIKFPWVQNADEFVSATLAKIEEFKKSAPAQTAAPAPSVVQNFQQSGADELAKFKSLLDNGTITQEEFDAKKKQLLGL